jgi:phosphoribosylformylglycinamidine (FGAM) synthase-like enzyme
MSHHGPVLPGCHGVPVRACAWQLPAPLYKQTAVVLFYTVVQAGWASTAVRTKQIEQSLSYETARLCVCVCGWSGPCKFAGGRISADSKRHSSVTQEWLLNNSNPDEKCSAFCSSLARTKKECIALKFSACVGVCLSIVQCSVDTDLPPTLSCGGSLCRGTLQRVALFKFRGLLPIWAG